MYGAVTLYGRPFQTVLLTLSYPSFNQVIARFARLRAAVRPLRGAALNPRPLGGFSRFAVPRLTHGRGRQ